MWCYSVTTALQLQHMIVSIQRSLLLTNPQPTANSEQKCG